MSVGEIAEIVTSLGLLFTAIVNVLATRRLRWLSGDLIQAIHTLRVTRRDAASNGYSTANSGLGPEANRE